MSHTLFEMIYGWVATPITIQVCVFALSVVTCFSVAAIFAARRDSCIQDRLRVAHDQQLTAPRPRRRQLGTWLLKIGRRKHSTAQHIQPSSTQRTTLGADFHQSRSVPSLVASRSVVGLAALVGTFCMAAAMETPPAYAAVLAISSAMLAAFLPSVWLTHRRKQRQLELRRALPDFLDLVVACLGGGMSFQASLQHVTGELKLIHPGLSRELEIVLGEMELGCTLDHALKQLATRTDLDELRTLRSFVYQTTKFGTTITEALSQLADMLRFQREQRAEEAAQKAAVKILFPTLLFIFPTVFVVLAGPAAIQIKQRFTESSSLSAGSRE